MTKSHILNRKVELPRQAALGLRLLSALLLGLALAATAFAQVKETRITTLLPSSTDCRAYDGTNWNTIKDLTVSDAFPSNPRKICYLEFSVESLPGDATITRATLRLVQKDRQPNINALDIKVSSIPKSDWISKLSEYEDEQQKYFSGIISSPKSKNDGAVDVWESVKAVFPGRADASGKYIALLLSPRATQSGRNYFPLTGDTSYTAGNQPRLILTYTVPRATPPRSPDSQSDGWAAMRSPKAFMPDPNTPPQNTYKPIQVFDGTRISSYRAATYGGLNHVVQKYATEWRLDARDVFGNVVWSKPLPSGLRAEKTRVVVNDAGRLTIVSENRFISYQLNAADPRVQPSSPVVDKTLSDVKAPAAMLPGADGGLYVIADGDLYALNPDMQMLWRTGVGTSADARMTLSPDGQYVYATGFLPEGKGLLAINAQSGKAPPLVAFPSATKTFHNPVVIKYPTGNTHYIYIAANSQNNGVLRTLKNTPTLANGDRVASLSQVKDETGLFSQPAPDATAPSSGGDLSSKRLYVVWKEMKEDQPPPPRLIPINAQTGTLENSLASPHFVVAETSELWSGGNLAMDAKGNIFFWENGIFYGYGKDIKQLFASTINEHLPQADRLPSELELLFGSDGTLYFQDSKVGTLWASIPSYQLATGQSVSISSPTHLRVEGTVDKVDGETTLSAGGNVTLGGEFKVKPGAKLRVKTNVPPQ